MLVMPGARLSYLTITPQPCPRGPIIASTMRIGPAVPCWCTPLVPGSLLIASTHHCAYETVVVCVAHDRHKGAGSTPGVRE